MSPFEQRTRQAQQQLADGEGVVLFPSTNFYYLTGFWEEPSERHLLLLIGAQGDPELVAPELAADQIWEATWLENITSYSDGQDPMPLVAEAAETLGIEAGRIYLDPTMWARFTQDLRSTLPEASFTLADSVMDPLRVRKDEQEIQALTEAAGIADQVSLAIRDLGSEVVGWTETELASEISDRLEARGGTDLPFPVIAGSGPNGAHPHHTHGDRVIEAGDPVVLDFGTRFDHYPSDQTRTVVFGGEPSETFKDAFEVVQRAQTQAVETVEPGVTAGSIDAAARSVIDAAGYGEQFVHRTGHGVGLDVHEEPYIVADSDRELEVGMVFSVEPGIYLPGEFGIRIEDLVVVTEDGCQRLNDSPRGWNVADG